MAKKLINWTMDNGILKMAKYIADRKEGDPIVIEAEFSLADFEAAMAKDEDFKNQCLTYLLKQKLMDSGASEIASPEGKVVSAKKRWKELLEAKWGGERVNATGKAENAQIAKTVKAARATMGIEELKALRTLGFQLSAEELKLLVEAESK